MEPSSPIHDRVIDFVSWMAGSPRPGPRIVSAPRGEARELVEATRRILGALQQWKPEHKRRAELLDAALAAIKRVVTSATSSGDYAHMTLSEADADDLRSALPFLIEYGVMREKDALYPSRGKRRG